MIRDFGNKTASDLYHNGSFKGLPRQYWQRAIHLLEGMEAVENFEELKEKGFPPSVRLHPLVGKRKGQWAIDIHKTSGWGMTFRFEKYEFLEVKVEDYH
ncbi:MAG: type II toxin-antitoxin system RelE/ParE family toxin [Bdellovibrionales bacterium]|nr:type II toxin-antitoxin system RelE/ParE family toxin [Bdellovibrionales bacterium]